MKSLNIVFLGQAGSGKGTQAAILKKIFSLWEIDTGTVLRELVKKPDYFGEKIEKVMAQGKLVPLWLAVYCWLDLLMNVPEDKGIILEGSPRQLEEAKILEEVLNWFGRKNFRAIYLKISDKEVLKRLLARRLCSQCKKEYSLILTPGLTQCSICGGKLIKRADDNPKAIKNRIEFFKKNTLPVINYFRKKKILIEVDGERPIEEISKEIIKKIKKDKKGK
ncbi:MAG: nucleoside monophosphate kinase [Candidatus Paceibacterota bacterium]